MEPVILDPASITMSKTQMLDFLHHAFTTLATDDVLPAAYRNAVAPSQAMMLFGPAVAQEIEEYISQVVPQSAIVAAEVERKLRADAYRLYSGQGFKSEDSISYVNYLGEYVDDSYEKCTLVNRVYAAVNYAFDAEDIWPDDLDVVALRLFMTDLAAHIICYEDYVQHADDARIADWAIMYGEDAPFAYYQQQAWRIALESILLFRAKNTLA
jgi:hypothetical protein